MLNRLRTSVLLGDQTNYMIQIDLYIEHYEHLRDSVKQLFHIALTQNHQIRTKHAHFCISIFAPMLLNVIQTLINYFNPKYDSEMSLTNYQVFFDFWIQLYIDIYDLFCLIIEQTGLRPSDKYLPVLTNNTQTNLITTNLYTSSISHQQQQPLPPQQSSTIQLEPIVTKTSVQSTSNNGLVVPSNLEINNNNQKFQIPEIVEPIQQPHHHHPHQHPNQQPPPTNVNNSNKLAAPSNYCANCCTCEQSRVSCCNKQANNGLNQTQMEELARKRSLEENEIVDKCKTMTQLVQTMFEFVNGTGDLKTTQDLFTQAENFGEEANRFYKIVRYLTYQVKSFYLNFF